MFWLLNVNIATSGKRHLKRNKCISDKESEPVWEWAGVVLHVGRAQSQWHGWSARHGRKGRRCRVTVGAYFAHDSPLINYLHIRWSFSWKHFAFWKLFLGLLGMTEPQAVPVAEPVFLRGTRSLWLFLRKNFFRSWPLLRYEATVPMFVVSEEFSWCNKARLPREKIPFHLGIDCPLTPPPTLLHAMWANISLFKKCRNKKMSKSIWVGRVGRFEQRPREKVFFPRRQLSNVSYLSATKLQHKGDFRWLQKIGKPPLCDFNSERALTLPTGNSLWQQMILLTSVGHTAFHDPWCPRPHTQVAQLWAR